MDGPGTDPVDPSRNAWEFCREASIWAWVKTQGTADFGQVVVFLKHPSVGTILTHTHFTAVRGICRDSIPTFAGEVKTAISCYTH